MPKLHKEPLTFEKVWKALMEDRELMRKQKKEADQRQKEADRRFEETKKLVEENSRQMGLLHNRFGELAEHMVAPGIVKKFNALGFDFADKARPRKIFDPVTAKILAEVDVFLENGSLVIAVEVKAKLLTRDVDDHIKRMDILRRGADFRYDNRKYRGAIAAAIVPDDAREHAVKAGFYILEQSGDTMKLDIPEGFVPRDW